MKISMLLTGIIFNPGRLIRGSLNLGNMSVHDLIDLDPETSVVNPAQRKLGKKTRKSTVKLGKLIKKAAKMKGAEADSLKVEIDELNKEVAADADRYARMPARARRANWGKTRSSRRSAKTRSCFST